jgi:hypothetical protein
LVRPTRRISPEFVVSAAEAPDGAVTGVKFIYFDRLR